MIIVELLLILSALILAINAGRIYVSGTHFMKDGKRVFLSGVNQAWIAYGYDFGDKQYYSRKSQFEHYLKLVHDNGGNSVRVWVHIEGATSPHFDGNGYVTGLDKTGSFINEFKEYLKAAHKYNILIFPCLWNGAQNHQDVHYRLDGLIRDTNKLSSYINKALIPFVNAVKNDPALGGWDIMNEFEGEIISGQHNADSCFDTSILKAGGAGWAGAMYSAQILLRFVNWQADAIRRADPHALVTAGSWNARDNTDKLNTHNLYSDHCLRKAGGKQEGILTFFSTHTYSWQGKYDQYAPFKHRASDYGLGKPFVIAEFNQVKGAGMDITAQFNYAYNNGYAGAWSWHIKADGSDTDSTDNQLRGLRSLRGKTDQSKGGVVNFSL